MIICGIDEVGRGCLCGPVTAAAAIIPKNSFDISILRDSKKLSPQKRETIASRLKVNVWYGIGWVYPHEIDKINIHHASLRAMQHALSALFMNYPIHTPLHIIVDGKFTPPLSHIPEFIKTHSKVRAEIKGDSKIAEIQAASIIAKTSRDNHMRLLANAFPHYKLETHKGYPTAFHKNAIKYYGYNSLYRKSFSLPS